MIETSSVYSILVPIELTTPHEIIVTFPLSHLLSPTMATMPRSSMWSTLTLFASSLAFGLPLEPPAGVDCCALSSITILAERVVLATGNNSLLI